MFIWNSALSVGSYGTVYCLYVYIEQYIACMFIQNSILSVCLLENSTLCVHMEQCIVYVHMEQCIVCMLKKCWRYKIPGFDRIW